MSSPVSLDKAENSIRNVPTPATLSLYYKYIVIMIINLNEIKKNRFYQVSVVSPFGTPFFRLTVPNGIPVGVLNALEDNMKKIYIH